MTVPTLLPRMSVLDSLPARPLSDAELAKLNRAETVELAVAVDDDEGPTDGLLLATDRWVKGLVFDGEGWRVAETVALADAARYDAMRTCEDAVRGFETADAPER